MYKSFINDYKNKNITTYEVMRKNNLNSKRYCRLRAKLIQDGEIPEKRHMNHTGAKFYIKKGDKYVVRKTTDNKTRIIGAFENESTAQMIVEACKSVDWQVNKIQSIIDENKIKPKHYYLLNGYYVVHKTINNERIIYCKVKQESEAKKIVSELEKNGWRFNIIDEIVEKLSINMY